MEETGKAAKDAAQKFLSDKGINVDLRRIEDFVRKQPLAALGIFVAAGFIVGGGVATRPGLALLAMAGRKTARETATNFATRKLFGTAQRGRRNSAV